MAAIELGEMVVGMREVLATSGWCYSVSLCFTGCFQSECSF